MADNDAAAHVVHGEETTTLPNSPSFSSSNLPSELPRLTAKELESALPYMLMRRWKRKKIISEVNLRLRHSKSGLIKKLAEPLLKANSNSVFGQMLLSLNCSNVEQRVRRRMKGQKLHKLSEQIEADVEVLRLAEEEEAQRVKRKANSASIVADEEEEPFVSEDFFFNDEDDESPFISSLSFVRAMPALAPAAGSDEWAAFEVAADAKKTQIWAAIARKHIPRAAKQLTQSNTARQGNMGRIAHAAAKEVKKVYAILAKSASATAKKQAREMAAFWKKNEKEERDMRKRAEKEAVERQRIEEELKEAKRQARKLNFLITQTELYSHFIAKKGTPAIAPLKAKAVREAVDFDEEDEEKLTEQAKAIASDAASRHLAKMHQFDSESQKLRDENAASGIDIDELNFREPTTMHSGVAELTQPALLKCTLKSYQLKGLSWLANLYEQGINGILADEMGLGKTVQSISLLTHLAERQNNWGPFLVIAPASTLHNWQQEFTKFAPDLKVIPYWGNVNDRKVLRKFWNTKKLYTRSSPFHVLITSYQLVISDEKYFQKIKWQYMILDEAQAIKSSSSTRWKTLLSFNCRNRLLLTGTPIQNSMQELWALLHFIMPSLFDSHDEFSEWFSKDIESHAENKGSLNQSQLSRLHMILKPFMLRRIKKDVENELGDKIELEIPTPLAPKQKRMYQGIVQKIPLQELLEKSELGSGSSAADVSVERLMNLVMQLRKICNHPELFERYAVESPFWFGVPDRTRTELANWVKPRENPISFNVPRLIADDLDEDRVRLVNRLLGKSNHLPHIVDVFIAEMQDEISLLETSAYLSENEDCPAQLKMLPKINQIGYCSMSAWKRVSEALMDRLLCRLPVMFLPKVQAAGPSINSSDTSLYGKLKAKMYDSRFKQALLATSSELSDKVSSDILPSTPHIPTVIQIPSIENLIKDSGKLLYLDSLLPKLKVDGHRVLVYFQMTKMMDLMEEYLQYRKYKHLRLDGSSKISDRRDMVTQWQTNPEIFVFLLSTRAGGLGINLTAADTVIFYDSDWNPTADQQAMDRAHRLGQTKQVTVYRLITKGSIEERILQRAREKDAIHKVVIAGGEFKQSEFKSKEIMSLLLEENAIDETMLRASKTSKRKVEDITDSIAVEETHQNGTDPKKVKTE